MEDQECRKKYTIIENKDRVELIHMVNKLLNRNWELAGQLTVIYDKEDNPIYIQPMVTK